MRDKDIRLALVHSDRLYRDSLGQCLTAAARMSVVCSEASLDSMDKCLGSTVPDVLIVQFGLSKDYRSEPALIRSSWNTKIIVIGVPNIDSDILSCIEDEGASGYVLMDASLEDLITNIHAVMNGETLCSPRIANLAFSRVSALARRTFRTPPNDNNGVCLTKRESEVAKLIDEGLSNKEIAARLHIEVSTVKNHVHNILDKLQIHNRYSAVKYLKEQFLPTFLL